MSDVPPSPFQRQCLGCYEIIPAGERSEDYCRCNTRRQRALDRLHAVIFALCSVIGLAVAGAVIGLLLGGHL